VTKFALLIYFSNFDGEIFDGETLTHKIPEATLDGVPEIVNGS
jgi:hypothetical protein